MAGRQIAINTANENALVAATAKTVLRCTAATNSTVKLLGFTVSFDSVTLDAEPVIVRLRRSTTAGTGTTVTAVKWNDFTGTIQLTATENFSAEPTDGDILRQWEIHPTSGIDYTFPLGQEPVMQGGTRLGIKITAPAGVGCLASMLLEE